MIFPRKVLVTVPAVAMMATALLAGCGKKEEAPPTPTPVVLPPGASMPKLAGPSGNSTPGSPNVTPGPMPPGPPGMMNKSPVKPHVAPSKP